MSAYPVLYSFRRCPYAIRARIALKRAGVICELREVLLREKPQEMLVVSSKGTVPVLLLRDGRVVDESLDIMLWALQQNDPDSWLDMDKRTQALIVGNDFDFKEKLDRYKYYERYPEYPREYYRRQAEVFLRELEALLDATGGRGLVQGRTTLADIALFPFVRQFARVDWDWFCRSDYTLLKTWLSGFEESELFLSIMHRHPPWHKGDPLTLLA